ncbi:hypothetical protein PMV44_14105 [Enterococcus casseliflavus]|uniref:hypothetical protein n=1 Tax=Enterococcus casseliflavus TaxID=37734 RepID=UPI00232A9558|nr:hypothetical protein [Enterococcus casseliflavus]MDB1692982.1 hypothetical protein [Enterococcus casseliflavus]
MKLTVRIKQSEAAPKRAFFSQVLPKKQFDYLILMNNSTGDIEKWSKRLVLLLLFFFSSFLLLSVLLGWQMMLVGCLFISLVYWLKLNRITTTYYQFRFERQVQFSDFEKLLVPLLKQSKGGINVRSILERLLPRIPNEIDKKILQNLMLDITQYPESYTPYENFAKQMSQTDSSILFMITLADLDQGVKDLRVIDRLAKIAMNETMEGIDQIIEYKLRRFSGLFMKIMLVIVIFLLGNGISIVLFQLGKLFIYF